MRFIAALASVGAIAIAVTGGLTPASAALNERGADPVVLKGSDVPELLGTDPAGIVAFKWDGSWRQIPFQVDERKTVSVRDLYPFAGPHSFVNDQTFNLEVYADPLTRVGADSDPTLDGNDELVAMASDAGAEADAPARPVGVVADSGVKIKVADPIDSGSAFVYLFRSSGGLDQGAGKQYVDYDFKLTTLGAGETYLTGYNFPDGPNPEASTVKTPFYETHSSDRWIDDQLKIMEGVSSPVDILDRDKAGFVPGNCARSENTFSGYTADVAEGSYIINKSGPVRAIRSYIGANSGPYTQREHIYYAQRQDTRTFLRVHAIPAIMAFLDYSPAATGMTYRSTTNPGGVTIDGVPDPGLVEGVPPELAEGDGGWEQVTGAQGTLDLVSTLDTNVGGLTFTNYYLDDSTPGGGVNTQCTGDAFAYGSSGFRVTSAIPNTDPRSTHKDFGTTRYAYYGAPGGTAAGAERHVKQATRPLTVAASQFTLSRKAALKIKVKPAKRTVQAGRKARFKVELTNRGGAATKGLKLCLKGPGKIRGLGCKAKPQLGAGKSRAIALKLKVKGTAKPHTYKVSVAAKATGIQAARKTVKIKVPK